MGVKVPDFISGMLILYSFRTYSLPGPIVECHEETTARLPKFHRGGAAPHHTILGENGSSSIRLPKEKQRRYAAQNNLVL